nr:NAD(+) synthase [Acetatifactor sp.]
DILKAQDYYIARNPFVPADNATRDARCRRILQIQANGLATRVRATGIRNLVIGVSGGLDSTLALIVCAEAKKLVPEIRIISYTMPNQGNTSKLTHDNASRLMELLSDETHEIPIREGVELHLAQLGHALDYQGEGDVTYENAQARMRTYLLMDAANMKNALVVGTGDLSELALGWCTYNGDHMSMYAVNASVPKTLVRFVCKAYAEICGSEEIKEVLLSICDTPISPELTPSNGGEIAQKTEEKIGKYDLNDFFLYYVLRYGFEPARAAAYALKAYPELSLEEVKTAARNFFKRFFTQQFKRSCLPDGPKVGSVTLSPRGDWRMPSDASVALWMEDLATASASVRS